MMPKRTLITSLQYAWQGLGYAFKTQRNMRIHFLMGVVALGACWWLRVSLLDGLIIGLTVSLVLVAELLNTAVEVLVDLLSQERRPDVKIIKDLAAGAVLVCCLGATMIGCAVFLPRLVERLIPIP